MCHLSSHRDIRRVQVKSTDSNGKPVIVYLPAHQHNTNTSPFLRITLSNTGSIWIDFRLYFPLCRRLLRSSIFVTLWSCVGNAYVVNWTAAYVYTIDRPSTRDYRCQCIPSTRHSVTCPCHTRSSFDIDSVRPSVRLYILYCSNGSHPCLQLVG